MWFATNSWRSSLSGRGYNLGYWAYKAKSLNISRTHKNTRMLGIKTQSAKISIINTLASFSSVVDEYDCLHWKDLDSTEMRNQTPRRRFSKPRIGQAAKEVLKPSNRTHDLHTLTSQFDVLKIKLSQLIEALKVHYKAMSQINISRLTVSSKVRPFVITFLLFCAALKLVSSSF